MSQPVGTACFSSCLQLHHYRRLLRSFSSSLGLEPSPAWSCIPLPDCLFVSMAPGDQKQRMKELKDQMTELKEKQDKQQVQIDNLQRRQDRLDKCTQVVVEHSAEIESVFSTAETSRVYKDVARDSAAGVLKELAHCLSFPHPLPPQSPEEWYNLGEDQQKHPLPIVKKWWELSTSLSESVIFVTPNKARSTRDPATQQWKRSPQHFILRLAFGLQSLQVQSILSGSFGKYYSDHRKKLSEEGAATIINLFINRTKEELERKRSRQEADGKGKGGKGGKGNRGRGRGRQ